jgi:hypothetical protein
MDGREVVEGKVVRRCPVPWMRSLWSGPAPMLRPKQNGAGSSSLELLNTLRDTLQETLQQILFE